MTEEGKKLKLFLSPTRKRKTKINIIRRESETKRGRTKTSVWLIEETKKKKTEKKKKRETPMEKTEKLLVGTHVNGY